MIKNDKFSNRTKHIDTKFHFIKDLVAKKEIRLEYVDTKDNVADMLTKPLAAIKLRYHAELAGISNSSYTIEGKC